MTSRDGTVVFETTVPTDPEAIALALRPFGIMHRMWVNGCASA
ncbi:hypothetical protein [Caulobacter endophyticus]|nr:hypothetical protein [Caulobacter endophyticus]